MRDRGLFDLDWLARRRFILCFCSPELFISAYLVALCIYITFSASD